MTMISKTITLRKNFTVSYLVHHPSRSKDSIIFIHGYGSAKEHFRFAFASTLLENYGLIAPDLVGFGHSAGPDDFGYSMKDQACVIIELLDVLGIDTFHLVAHSMGGLIAMEIAEMAPQRMLSLINMEGNLTPEDCFISGLITRNTYEEFAAHGRSELEEDFRKAGINDVSMSEYAGSFSLASTTALYKSAYHTVNDSVTPLVERFARNKNICYIYGEKNKGKLPSEKLLRASNVPIFYIENSGHSMAAENPGQLYQVIRTFIDELEFD